MTSSAPGVEAFSNEVAGKVKRSQMDDNEVCIFVWLSFPRKLLTDRPGPGYHVSIALKCCPFCSCQLVKLLDFDRSQTVNPA